MSRDSLSYASACTSGLALLCIRLGAPTVLGVVLALLATTFGLVALYSSNP